MIPRKTPLKRSVTPLKRTAVKSVRLGARRGPADVPAERWRNPGYLVFLREQGRCLPCMVAYATEGHQIVRASDCDPMHGPVNGVSSKGADAEAMPGCRPHHIEQHRIGWPAFEAKYGFDRQKESAAWWALYQIYREAKS